MLTGRIRRGLWPACGKYTGGKIIMMTKAQLEKRRKQALALFKKAGIVITKKEYETIEAADFGLGAYEQTGLGVLVYVNTDRCCAKELAMLPRQICPEHRHPPISWINPGKEETFRCRWGTVYLYVPGKKTVRPHARSPRGREKCYTVWREIVLKPGDQYTLKPNTLHWFQSGPSGAVVSEFSTRSLDEKDVFTDPEIQRITRVKHPVARVSAEPTGKAGSRGELHSEAVAGKSVGAAISGGGTPYETHP